MRWWEHEVVSAEVDREGGLASELLLAGPRPSGETIPHLSNTERILDLTGAELELELARLQDVWRDQPARAHAAGRVLSDYEQAHARWRYAPTRSAREAALPAFSSALARVRDLVLGRVEARRRVA